MVLWPLCEPTDDNVITGVTVCAIGSIGQFNSLFLSLVCFFELFSEILPRSLVYDSSDYQSWGAAAYLLLTADHERSEIGTLSFVLLKEFWLSLHSESKVCFLFMLLLQVAAPWPGFVGSSCVKSTCSWMVPGRQLAEVCTTWGEHRKAATQFVKLIEVTEALWYEKRWWIVWSIRMVLLKVFPLYFIIARKPQVRISNQEKVF